MDKYPHQKLIEDNNINISALPENIQDWLKDFSTSIRMGKMLAKKANPKGLDTLKAKMLRYDKAISLEIVDYLEGRDDGKTPEPAAEAVKEQIEEIQEQIIEAEMKKETEKEPVATTEPKAEPKAESTQTIIDEKPIEEQPKAEEPVKAEDKKDEEEDSYTFLGIQF